MSYRSYMPWSKNASGTSYSSSGSSYAGIPKNDTSTSSATDSKYTSGYSSGRYGGSTGTGTGTSSTGSTYRGTTGTTSTGSSSYRPYSSTDRVTTPSKYGSTSTASNYQSSKDKDTKDTKDNDRPSIREKYNMGPALPSTTTTTTSTSVKDVKETEKPSIRDKYSLNRTAKDDTKSLIDKYSTGTYPGRASDTGRSYGSSSSLSKEDTGSGYSKNSLPRTTSTRNDKSPVRHTETPKSYGSSSSLSKEDIGSSYSKGSLNTSTATRNLKSPEPDKSIGYSSLSPYRLYGRSSTYSRTSSKDTDTSSTATTPATTPVSTPTSLSYGSSRFGVSSVRSPVAEKPPPVFGVSLSPIEKVRRPWSPRQTGDEAKDTSTGHEALKSKETQPKPEEKEEKKVETVMVAVVTRGTSPTPPSSSAFLRTRRADLARVIEKNISRPVVRPEMVDKEIQSDRGDDTARLSRFGGTSRSGVTPWSSYLDRYSAVGSTVSKYASTRGYGGYSSTRDRDATVRSSPSGAMSPTEEITKTKVGSERSEATDTKPPTTMKEETKPPSKPPEKAASDLSSDSTKLTPTSLKKADSLTKSVGESNGSVATKTPAEPPVLARLRRIPSAAKLAEASNDNKSTKESGVSLSRSSSIKSNESSVKKSETNGNKLSDKLKSTENLSNSKNDSKESDVNVNKTPTTKIGDTSVKKNETSNNNVNKLSDKLKSTENLSKLKIESKESESLPKKVVGGDSPTSKSIPALSSPVISELQSKLESITKSSSKSKDEESSSLLKKSPSAVKLEESSAVKTLPNSAKPLDKSKETAADPERSVVKAPSNGLKLNIDGSLTKKEDASVAAGSSAKSKESKPLKRRDSATASDSESIKPSSSTHSLSSEGEQVKSPPLSPPPSIAETLAKLGSPAANRKFLPPPVPKADGLKTSPSQNSVNKSVSNKDFRKSTLNMDVAPTEAEEVQRLQEKQRLAAVIEKKLKRTNSTSSDKSDGSEATEPSEAADVRGKSAPLSRADSKPSLLKTSKSLTNAKIVPNTNFTSKTASDESPKLPNRVTIVPSPSLMRKSRSPSTETSSSEETSCSSSDDDDDDDEEEEESRSGVVNMRSRSSRSPSTADKRKSGISVNSLLAASSADESSLAEKPPRPPSSPKPPPKEESKSFLMRALAPVTNLFKSRTPDSLGSSSENIPESLPRSASTQSLTKSIGSDKEDKSKSEKVKVIKKNKIRHIESGERAWWLDSNSNIPEGVQRNKSSKSISKMSSDSDNDLKTSKSISKISSDSENDTSKKSEKSDKVKSKNRLLKHAESGERAWWLDSNANIPEGIERIKSNASINQKITESDKEDSTKLKSKKFKIKHIESGERAWWLENSASSTSIPGNIQKMGSVNSVPKIIEPPQTEENFRKFPIRHQESGEKAWWLNSNSSIPEGILKNASKSTLAEVKEGMGKEEESSESSEEESEEIEHSEDDEENKKKGVTSLPKFPLEIQESRPLPTDAPVKTAEVTGRTSPYDNVVQKTPAKTKKKRPKDQPLFISNHTNIDDILGTASSLVNPAMGLSRLRGECDDDSGDDEDSKEMDPHQVRVHDSTAKTPTIQPQRVEAEGEKRRKSAGKLDDAALQLYKDGDYGSYLDLEASINEQQEEFEGFQTNRKNSIVLRTQLSVRVHTIIEKLLNSEGRELRRALFSLKQIFQEDKDLVHEFVQNDGLACLIKVGSEADQNYQNYILRALGQVMLYVDGMNGVMDHNRTVQWLYALIASKFRLVVKTALKLLLVFVEYVETNCLLLIKAVNAVDAAQGCLPWSNIMRLIKDYDAADTELLIYATTLVNKTFNGVPDQDTYYDQVDALEEQGMEGAIQRYMSKQGTDLDLLRQFQIYEAVLHHEDGEEKGTPLRKLDESIRKTLRNRKSLAESLTTERRKSRRHSTGTAPLSASLNHSSRVQDDDESGSSSSRSSPGPGELPHLNGSYKDKQTGDAGVTPALRRRRERAERQRSFIREQQETAANLKVSLGLNQDCVLDENDKQAQRLNNGSCDSNKLSRASSRKDITPLMNAVNKLDSVENDKALESNGHTNNTWTDEGDEETSERKALQQLKRENTVKDLTQKLASQNILHSPVEEKMNRIGDMSGLISKAKEGLAKSKSKDILKSSSGDVPKLVEVKKSETELHWEELVSSMKRPLAVCDLDFTDLKSDDEVDILSPIHVVNGIPPPPPPVPMAPGMSFKDAPPPPPPNRLGNFIPPCPTTPISLGINSRYQQNTTSSSPEKTLNTPISNKTKKTVKLFWKEVRDDPIILAKLQKSGMIWDELLPVPIDTQKLEHLFESRAKDLITKEKQQELNKNKEIIVLDHKRSNAINIGMTKLPPPRSIKTAILKMDATIMNREGIEKLLTMLPTDEERTKIQEAQMANPETPLGSAEQFLLTLTSISELPARLKLWAFKLDYENSEKEIAEPLMDLKQGIETLKVNKTFRGILSTLLSIGIFLNGSEVKGFQIEYLAKVPEVKDTVHKHSLLHHLSHMVMEKFPEATDLYSEIGSVTRASKVDFDDLDANIVKMEQECKASWDHLKLIAKHDGSTNMKVKMSDFLADCAERIIVLGIVHRRVMNRYHQFLLWLGIPMHRVQDMKPNEFCRIVSEFALEYRTTRERVLQQLEKKANHRERNKTRGKMITEVGKFSSKEDRADAELRHLLGNDLSDAESISHGTLPWRRQRKDLGRTVLGPLIRDEPVNGNLTDGDDEILESLVKTATKAPGTRTTPRERKRTRQADRKSLKRSRTRENNMEGEGSASP